MAERRNPFEKLQGGEEPAAYIPPPASKAKRRRGWEREHPATSYRIPLELREAVKKVATQLGVPTDEVARALLEHGLAAYQAGQLRLHAAPTEGRFSLFPRKSR